VLKLYRSSNSYDHGSVDYFVFLFVHIYKAQGLQRNGHTQSLIGREYSVISHKKNEISSL